MKRILKIIVIALIILLTIKTITYIINSQLKKEIDLDLKPYFEAINAEEDVISSVKIMKAKIPMQVPGNMIIYDINYDKKNGVMNYYYKTLQNKNEFNNDEVETYKQNWKQNTINTMKNNPYNKSFIITEVDFIYNLVDINNSTVLTFNVNHQEYK